MENTALVQHINTDMAMTLPEKISLDELKVQLSSRINHLIETNFEALITLLYKIDVNEQKLKIVLRNNPGQDAGNIIADLIIERQQQKINFKNHFTNKSSAGSNEEKW
jgi:putative ubiquitin-RnfH superfamily antitoxin RatB of RatAB toxin-antitoxin module